MIPNDPLNGKIFSIPLQLSARIIYSSQTGRVCLVRKAIAAPHPKGKNHRRK
jgi:hypothetical protein